MALAFAPTGHELTVVKIMADEKTKRHLENLGLGAGSRFKAVSVNRGDMILQVKGGRLALNKALAMKIFVA